MRTLSVFLSMLIVSASPCLLAQEKPTLQAGAANSNITPDLGIEVVGGFHPFPATHVHDELWARCLVLESGEKRLALVTCDLLGFHRCVSDEARRLIQEQTGILPECVLISSTHTHSAGNALGTTWFEVDETPDDYQKFVSRRIADGVRRAVNELRPAELAFGTVEAPEHVFNRRWYLRPGTMPPNPFGGVDQVRMNPGVGNPNLVEPAGPIDPTISFLAVREPAGKPIALYASYSLHYVGGVGNGHISADYFSIFADTICRLQRAETQDPPYVAMMANGTSGDINNIDVLHPRPKQEPYEQMRFVANDVAKKVHAALADLKYTSDITLDARYRELPIATRRPTPELLEWSQKTLAAAPADHLKWDLPTVYAERTRLVAANPDTIQTPIHVLRIGNVAIGSLPNEVFCEIGLEFKDRSPIQPAFLVSIAHAYLGYLPTPRHHDLGGYETWLGTSRLEKDASVKMLNALLEMTAEMKPAP